MTAASPIPIGLIAGSGELPLCLARALRLRGHPVHAVAHRQETDERLAGEVTTLDWVRVGQLGATAKALRAHGVHQALMAGGIQRSATFTHIRPDFDGLRVAARLRRLTDDAVLRALAEYYQERGIALVPAGSLVDSLVAPRGLFGGPPLSSHEEQDVALGLRTARLLGAADVGQTVVVHRGTVLAVEAVEGTDACIRRAAQLGGPGLVVVKCVKPGQDERFDVPTVGPVTLEVLREVRARVLAVEAGRTLVLGQGGLPEAATRFGLSLWGITD